MWGTTLSDEEMIKIKVVDLKKLHNFVVDNFLILNHLLMKTMFEFLKFEIWIFKMSSNGEMTKTKVVDLEKLCNFVVDNFFYLKSSCQRKLCLNFWDLKFEFVNCNNNL